MRAAIVAYFDVGRSFGLTDQVFRPDTVAPLQDLRSVGFYNPFGSGVRISLSARRDIIKLWRETALEQTRRPHLDLGWRPGCSRDVRTLENDVRALVEHHSISRLDVTVYAIGTAFLHLEFGDGIDPDLAYGVMQAFEFAAYTPQVGKAIVAVASTWMESCLAPGVEVIDYACRPDVVFRRDERGNEEADIFTGFTLLCICASDSDDALIESIKEDWSYDAAELIEFEDAQMYFHWASNLLIAEKSENMPDRELRLQRPLAVMQTIHVLQGSCELIERIINAEVTAQVESEHVGGSGVGTPEVLNRLRALALAVTQRASYDRISQNVWDIQYYQKYEDFAHVKDQRERIIDACGVLYSIQLAEQQRRDAVREGRLGSVLFVLTTLTLVSVHVDAYSFVREDDPLITSRIARLLILGALAAAIGLMVYLLTRRRTRTRTR